MGNLKITYTDKVALTDDPTIPRKNKATDDDFNELKNVINKNAENFNAGATIDNNADLFLNVSKNLFNPSNSLKNMGIGSNGVISSSTYNDLFIVPVEVGKTYVFSFTDNGVSGNIVWGFSESVPVVGGSCTYNVLAITDLNGTTFTPTGNQKYLCIRLNTGGSNQYQAMSDIQCEVGNQATSYEPYIVPTIYSGGNPILFSGEQNFSLEEQRIGTWIDGKPLYRKTFILDPNISAATTATTLYPSLSNIDTCLLDIDNSYWTDTVGNGIYYPLCVFHATQSFQVGFFPVVSAGVSRVDVRKGTSLSIARVVLTLKYTKTTD